MAEGYWANGHWASGYWASGYWGTAPAATVTPTTPVGSVLPPTKRRIKHRLKLEPALADEEAAFIIMLRRRRRNA